MKRNYQAERECAELDRSRIGTAQQPAAQPAPYAYDVTCADGESELVYAAYMERHGKDMDYVSRVPLYAALPAQAAGLTDDEIERLISRFIGNVAPGLRNDCRALVREVLSRAAPSGEPVAYVECRECGRCGHTGINDAHSQDECCSNCDWTGPAPKEDVCPGCAQTGTMRAACPKCGSVYRLLCEATVGAAPQPSEKQAEQPAEKARGVDMRAALDMARTAMVSNGLTPNELPRVFEIIDAALLAAPAAATAQEPPSPPPITARYGTQEYDQQTAFAEGWNACLDAAPQAATGAQGLTEGDRKELDLFISHLRNALKGSGHMAVCGNDAELLDRAVAILAQAAPASLHAESVKENAERLQGAAADALQQIGALLGAGEQARTLDVIMPSIRNLKHLSDCLAAIEREFFMVPGEPDEELPGEEVSDECLLNSWGSTVEQYVDQFRQLGIPHLVGRAIEQQMTAAARDVLRERQRQITAEGWTPEHDDQHSPGTLAQAAACYIEWNGWEAKYQRAGAIPVNWPWDPKWWKPSDDRRNLVKALALGLAEIERLDRAALAASKERA
ncbi:hypothetical protein J5T34_05760 [Cupriavidus gilardii]|uniref:hypothetical protein n=1 Tax=Cupriavidus gilardii TaxID=82541 RepID=UPI001ABE45ED|nr:hypothetical protein [Cupriavidus gilardii]MBO4120244.1 hypothetical protein [Cupriavidus gilardii]